MQIPRAVLIFLFFSTMLPFGACAGDDARNSNVSNSNAVANGSAPVEIVPQDDVEELGKIVKLPVVPEEATYIENVLNDKNAAPRRAAPDERKLVAVLKFTAGNADQLAAQSERPAPADVDAEMWFPPELIAKSQETGDEYLKGTAYAANSFMQPPYINGRLTRINDTDYFVLELASF